VDEAGAASVAGAVFRDTAKRRQTIMATDQNGDKCDTHYIDAECYRQSKCG